MKQAVSKVIADVVGITDLQKIQEVLETPPDSKMGDLAIPCFSFAKVLRKNPAVIASEVKEQLESHKEELGIDHIEATGG